MKAYPKLYERLCAYYSEVYRSTFLIDSDSLIKKAVNSTYSHNLKRIKKGEVTEAELIAVFPLN